MLPILLQLPIHDSPTLCVGQYRRLTELLDAPAVADDGVVDADYRVIIPPYSTHCGLRPLPSDLEKIAPQDDDEWNAADDALTP
jgi:hypothetical protein